MSKMSYVDKLTWERLQATLKKVDEPTCKKMIYHELKHQRRLPFVFRMHGRFNKLRATREREEIAKGVF